MMRMSNNMPVVAISTSLTKLILFLRCRSADLCCIFSPGTSKSSRLSLSKQRVIDFYIPHPRACRLKSNMAAYAISYASLWKRGRNSLEKKHDHVRPNDERSGSLSGDQHALRQASRRAYWKHDISSGHIFVPRGSGKRKGVNRTPYQAYRTRWGFMDILSRTSEYDEYVQQRHRLRFGGRYHRAVPAHTCRCLQPGRARKICSGTQESRRH